MVATRAPQSSGDSASRVLGLLRPDVPAGELRAVGSRILWQSVRQSRFLVVLLVVVTLVGVAGTVLVPNALGAALDAAGGQGDLTRALLRLATVFAVATVATGLITCHLDPTAERRAEEAFARRAGTLIVIAHRISSTLRARRILVLDGVSAVVGDHLTLLSTSRLYRELLGHWHAPRPVRPGACPGRDPTPDRAVRQRDEWRSHGPNR